MMAIKDNQDNNDSMIAEDAVRHISKEEASSIISEAAQQSVDLDNLDMLE